MGKITSIDGGGTPDQMAEDMRTLIKALPHILEFTRQKAIVTRQYYLSLMENGFSAKEALEIIKYADIL